MDANREFQSATVRVPEQPAAEHVLGRPIRRSDRSLVPLAEHTVTYRTCGDAISSGLGNRCGGIAP